MLSGLEGVGKGHLVISLDKLKAFVMCTLIELSTLSSPMPFIPSPG